MSDPLDPPRPALVSIPNVELIHAGIEWETSTGVFTFTAEDLQSAIASQADPAVRTPVIKLGHTDPRFDGQPAVGRLANLRLSEDGLTLLGDYIAVPAWLADAIPSAYPRRSIEGWFNYASKAGNSHPFVLTAVSLLGEAYPAITTLVDIEAVFGADAIESIEMIAASSPAEGELVVATKVEDHMPRIKTKVDASASTSDVQRAFYESDQGDSWDVWIREFYVDPNELIISDERDGKTYSVAYTINGDEVEFGDRVQVRVVYQPVNQVAASALRVPVEVFATKAESRPSTNDDNESKVKSPEDTLTPDQLKVLSLPEDATDEQITARLTELATKAETPVPGEEAPVPGTETTETTETETVLPGSAPVVVPQQEGDDTTTALSNLPEGVTVIDKDVLSDMQDRLARADELVVATQKQKNRDLVAAAQAKGKFAPVHASRYEQLLERDPEGTKELIDMLPENVVPVTELGRDGSQQVAASEAAYDRSMLSAAELARIDKHYAQQGA